jgi:hypothetical protein
MAGQSHTALSYLILWGFVATIAMTAILQGSQGLGLSRLSLPFLVGTFFTGNRRRAVILGFIAYTIGGWLFAFLYYFAFASVGIYTRWVGTLAGFVHGLFLLVCALPLLPFVHPRMASEYYGAASPLQKTLSGRGCFDMGSRSRSAPQRTDGFELCLLTAISDSTPTGSVGN